MKRFVLLLLILITGCVSETPTPKPQPLSDLELEQQLFSLFEFINNSDYDRDAMRQTVNLLAQSKDERLLAPFIELLQFADPDLEAVLIQSLQDISGENLNTWSEGITYLANREEVPLPPRYLTWKGEKLSYIDPDFQLFFKDGQKQAESFRPELAVWGGVRVANKPGVDKGIPPLEEPKTIPGNEATYLRDNDTVYGIVVNGKARAYPQRIIDWHEMVNDVIDGQHFSVAYCTLCGAAIAYDTERPDGFLTFSSSGMLYQSNKIMFDRQTETLWNHILGDPVLGPQVGEIDELPLLSIEYTNWKDWLEQHPDTDVLDIDTGFNRNYDRGVPSYNLYYDSPDVLFPISNVMGPFQEKDKIFGLSEEVARAYNRSKVYDEKVINDVFNDRKVVIFTKGENFGIRAYESMYEFEQAGDALEDESGVVWEITDEALISGTEELARIPGHESYWFGWVINYPNTTVYT